jgi:hypothetical protein
LAGALASALVERAKSPLQDAKGRL